MFSQKRWTCSTVLAAVGLLAAPAVAQTKATRNLTQKAGKYAVDLRIPQEGLYADEETDIEFHVADLSQDDPVQGAPPIVKAKIAAKLTMPAMPAMPAQDPKTHSEGVPGDYGVVVYFPHGGDYQLDLRITPPEDKAFTVAFKVPVNDASAARKPKPKPFTLDTAFRPREVRADTPTDITLVVRSRDTRQPVTDFDLVHEKKMHFVIVSKDLGQFAHEHPAWHEDGTFTLRYTFPTGGEYYLFADVAPHEAGDQVLMQTVNVKGTVPSPPDLKGLGTTDTVDGVKVALSTEATRISARRTLPLAFSIKDAASGAPITDLEPYLGAMAHLILIQEGA